MNVQAEVAGKTAVVTGAASGIGLAVARALLEQGVNVCAVDLNAAGLEEAFSSFRFPKQLLCLVADVGSEETLPQVYERVTQELGTVQILVNNAGLQFVSAVTEFPIQQWDRLIRTMLRGPFLYTRHFLPGMLESGWGRIVNLASIHALVASRHKSAYITAKHGLLGLTRTVALEAAERGVTVNAISPAYVRSPLVEQQIARQAEVHGIPAERVIQEIMLAPMPQKELIEPEEVAQAVLFLCSKAARHINGHNLVIDGGWTAA